MNVKNILTAAVALLITLPAAFAEPSFYFRSVRSGVLPDSRIAEPEPPVPEPEPPGPVTCDTLPRYGLVPLPGFVAADFRFAESYLGCELPVVAGTVKMVRSDRSLAIGYREISTSLVMRWCGMDVPEMEAIFSLGRVDKTIVFYVTSAAVVPGRYGGAVVCALASPAQPGVTVSFMLMPVEIIVP